MIGEGLQRAAFEEFVKRWTGLSLAEHKRVPNSAEWMGFAWRRWLESAQQATETAREGRQINIKQG